MEMRKGLAILGLILFGALAGAATSSAATTRYISQNGGAFSGGTACNGQTAISASKFNSTTNSPGDINYLCGTITTPLSPSGNGSSGNVVSIKFDTGANITVSSCGSNGCIYLGGMSYYLIDGSPNSTPCGYVNGVDTACNGFIEATGNGTGSGSATSTGIWARNGATNIEIRNLGIYNMYVHTGYPGNDTASNNYYCIWFQGSNSSFHNLVEHDCYAGLVGEVTSDHVQFFSNHVYNINWGLFGSGSFNPQSITNWSVHDNDIHDWANWDTTSDFNHHDGIFFAGNDGTATDINGVDIYNNYMHGHNTDCPSNCMTAFIYIMDAENVRVYNNLLVPNSGDYVYNGFIFDEIITSIMPGMVIANNTVIGGSTVSGNGSCIYANGISKAVVENNIVSNCPVLLRSDAGTTFSSLNDNVYQNSSLSGSWQQNNSFFSSLATWKSATGAEASSQATTGSLGLSSTNHEQQSGSIVIEAGANLTSLGISALDKDLLGNARPSSGAWDAGAYELVSTAGNPPAPPTNLKATAQ
jgi:hypothetical protein